MGSALPWPRSVLGSGLAVGAEKLGRNSGFFEEPPCFHSDGSSVYGFPFPASLSAFIIPDFPNDRHSDWGEAKSS